MFDITFAGPSETHRSQENFCGFWPGSAGFALLVLVCLTLSACGSSSGGGSNPPPDDPPVVQDPPPPIAGDPAALLSSAITTKLLAEPITDDVVSPDNYGREVMRTRIQIDFTETATVAEANELLLELGASITSSVQGIPNVAVHIPDPGSLSELDSLISGIRTRTYVDAVLKSYVESPRILPENVRSLIFDGRSDPEAAAEWRFAGQHLAVRAAAAWNALEAIQGDARMIFDDWFGQGDPKQAQPSREVFDISPMSGQSIGFNDIPLPAECTNATGTVLETCNELRDDRKHGYWTLGVATGTHFTRPGNPNLLHEQVTGILPFTSEVRISDRYIARRVSDSNLTDVDARNQLIAIMRATAASNAGMIVVNLSNGFDDCDAGTAPGEPCRPIDDIRDDVRSFIRAIRFVPNLENRVLLVSAVGNRAQGDLNDPSTAFVGTHDATTDSVVNAAGLIPAWPDALGQNTYAALTNVLAVENARKTPRFDDNFNTHSPPLGRSISFQGQCTADSSFIGGHVAGIGSGGVFSSQGAGVVEQVDDAGTSSATPQVAGLAAYMSAIDPTLTPQRTIDIIRAVATPLPAGNAADDCSDVNPSDYPRAPLIDALASVLALDPPGNLDPNSARVRNALMDVTGPDDYSDLKFDFADLDKMIASVDIKAGDGAGTLDYGRYDLNGDGYTGGVGGARFDLDADDVVTSNPYSTVTNIELLDALDVAVLFDEKAVTDMQVLCYYAYSDLYVGDKTLRDNRMRPFAKQCACSGTTSGSASSSKAMTRLGKAEFADQCLAEDPPLLVTATKVTEFAGSVDIFKVSPDGQTIQQLTFDPDPRSPKIARHPAWSPDRSRIAFHWNRNFTPEIVVMDADGANKVQVMNVDKLPEFGAQTQIFARWDVAWSPDGTKLAFPVMAGLNAELGRGIYVVNADGTGLQEMLSTDKEVEIFEISWSPDGSQMVFAASLNGAALEISIGDIVTETFNGKDVLRVMNTRALTSGGGIKRSPRFSPDGSEVLYIQKEELASDSDVFAIGIDGFNVRRLTGPDEPVGVIQLTDYDAAWSPGGDRVAVVRNVIVQDGSAEDATTELFVMGADGSTLTQLTPTDIDFTVHEVAWAPQ